MQIDSPVTIHINEVPREFPNEATLKNYLSGEINFWSWMKSMHVVSLLQAEDSYNQQLKNLGSTLFYQYFGTQLGNALAIDPQNYNQVWIGALQPSYHESTSAFGRFILEVKNKFGDAIALFTYLYIDPALNFICQDVPAVLVVMHSPAFVYERSVAAAMSVQYREASTAAYRAHQNNLTEFINEFQGDAQDLIIKLGSVQVEQERLLSFMRVKHREQASRIQRSYAKRVSFYRDFSKKIFRNINDAVRETGERAEKTAQEAHDRLAATDSAFQDRMRLSYSVKYWQTRQEGHEKSKVKWFGGIVLSLFLTFFSVIGYYGVGGVSGFSKVVHSAPVERAVESPGGSESKVEAATSLFGRSASELSAAVADLVGAALLIALMSTLIKISLRQFNAHSMYAQDAAERVTFVQTYLALLSEGQLSNEDRRLALDSLFKSSQAVSLSEISFSSPIESLIQTLTEKKQ